MDTLIVALRVVLSLGVVLGLLWYLQRRLTKGGGRQKAKADLVVVVGRQAIGQKASVVVVDVDGQRLVLGVTEQSVSVLHGSDTPVPEPATAAPGYTADAFARSLTTATSAEPVLTPPLAFRPRRAHGAPTRVSATTNPDGTIAPSSRLAGSILSPATWQQTAAALRHGR
ncbi:MAG: flagellar biosynthetic protein FliO [Cryobacterium sp.]|uniref:flagellar biosynthetic protein FliO n=1 Tax=unclassified Cryobacterium TaxID=2649013 RepID=UPI0018CAA06D|nr:MULTISPECIES: flagellar biosynthetic protein FliO [unclassified Cryobacterium]MCY7404472.1 flagellar biosynthetic protein FliO [Cryobacterium sp.]MEC5153978.1 flagellar protein FliO/FliZ [Cryobacterium sp. CAN_C3]